MKVEVDQVYMSAGVNRAYHCLAVRGQTVLHGASNAIAVLERDEEGAFRMRRTLCVNGHTDKVNCVRWVQDNIFLSGSVDKSVILWRDLKPVARLAGHSESVTSVDGLFISSEDLVIVSASGDGRILVRRINPHPDSVQQPQNLQEIKFGGGSFALNVRLASFPSKSGKTVHLLFACMDNCKINIYSWNGTDFEFCHALVGHENWCQCVEAVVDQKDDSLLVATGGQDHLIRVWKLIEVTANGNKPENDKTEIKLKEVVFEVGESDATSGSRIKMSARVETILSGHEDRVTGLNFFTDSDTQALRLLSSSMDKTMIVWKPSSENEGDSDGVWTDDVRVGEVGGNTLGFFGCQIISKDHLVGYSFNGALHSWTFSSQGTWEPGVVSGGHFDSVQDLDWEYDNGQYLVSTSLDQTTRVHAPWHRNKKPLHQSDSSWHEIARPQVHGHDLFCLATLPNHGLVSGAEEKIVRAFESPQMFMTNHSRISGGGIVDSRPAKREAQGASVPSLGLSNKPVLFNEDGDFNKWSVPEDERHVKDKFPDFYFNPETHNKPPPEETLVQNTLWPEVRKLYGHGNELYCLASNGRLVASACRASKAEQAEVILWDATNWSILQKLTGHNLTVTQMEFSPSGEYLLTVSRDRNWCLYKEEKEEGGWTMVGRTQKNNSVHQRLLWTCSWSADSKYFATGSRDKKVALWSVGTPNQEEVNQTSLGVCQLACITPLVLESPVTAIAFLPTSQDHSENMSRLLAVGLENGKLVVVRWTRRKSQEEDEWKTLAVLDNDRSHHKTVKRIKVRRPSEKTTPKSYLVATCSDDHFVKLHNIKILDAIKQ